MRSTVFYFLKIFSIAVGFLILGFIVFLSTSKGSTAIAKELIKHYLQVEDITIEDAQGNLFHRLTWRNVTVKHMPKFPVDAVLKMAELHVAPNVIHPRQSHVTVKSGRLFLPQREPVLFDGDYNKEHADLIAMTPLINLQHLIGLFPQLQKLPELNGLITDVYVKASGPVEHVTLEVNARLKDVAFTEWLIPQGAVSLQSLVNLKEKSLVPAGQADIKDLILRTTFVPEGKLDIQTMTISFSGTKKENVLFNVVNASFSVPNSGPIYLRGTYQNNILNANVYTKWLNVEELFNILNPNNEWMWSEKITGMTNDIDLNITGAIFSPTIQGHFKIDQLHRNGFVLADTEGRVDLHISHFPPVKQAQLVGKVFVDQGALASPRSAVIHLHDSHFLFEGDPKRVKLNLHGESDVDDTHINVSLEGPIEQPELNVLSSPPQQKNVLLVMLLTNQPWKGTQEAFNTGEISPEVAKDFSDYFLFNGQGNVLTQKLGIKDVSFSFEKGKRGVGFKKDIYKNLDATYEVEEATDITAQKTYKQTVGGELKVSPAVSITADKELEAQNDDTHQITSEDKPVTDSKVMLKIKTNF
jgi:hypothetical protein